jgi:N-acetylmuramoyl-L-alanine amidase
MIKSSHRLSHYRTLIILGFILTLILLVCPAQRVRSDNFVFYSPRGYEVVPIEMIGNVKYLPLLPVLNAVGSVSGWQEKRKSMTVYFGKLQLELRMGDKKVKVGKAEVALQDPIRASNGQWMVPLDFVHFVVPRLAERTSYRTGSERIFIGDVKPASFAVSLKSLPNGSRLSVQFTNPVRVRTVSRNGRYVVFLGNQPFEPLEQAFRFEDPYVTELTFDDQDGVPKLILTPGSAALNFYSSETAGGRTLLVDLVKPGAAPSPQGPTASPPVSTGTAGPATPSAASKPAGPAATVSRQAVSPETLLPAVVLDPGHGGEDTGARSRDGVLEKDLVEQVQDRVSAALAATHAYRVVPTRVGDADPDLDARDAIANVAHAIAFLSLHAGSYGTGGPRVAVYTYAFPAPPALVPSEPTRLAFAPWDEVQRAHLERSRQLASALEEQFAKLSGITAPPPAEAPVHVLRSVDAPAVAIELGNLSPDLDAGILTDVNFQQQISEAIARAIEAFGGGTAKP